MLQVVFHPKSHCRIKWREQDRLNIYVFFLYFIREVGLNNLVSCNSVLEHNIL